MELNEEGVPIIPEDLKIKPRDQWTFEDWERSGGSGRTTHTVGPAEVAAGAVIAPGLTMKAIKAWGVGKVLDAGLQIAFPDAEDTKLEQALDFNKPIKTGIKATRLLYENVLKDADVYSKSRFSSRLKREAGKKIIDDYLQKKVVQGPHKAWQDQNIPQTELSKDISDVAKRTDAQFNKEGIDDGYVEEIVEQGDDVIYPEGSVEADIQANTMAMASDDINRLQYKADIEHNDYVKLQLKEWGMEDGVFRLDTFFSKVRKDPLTGVQQKSSTEGRRFIELFLTPKALMEDFNKLRSDPKGAHQIFRSRFVDMLEKRGLDPSLVNYHHIAGLYDALPLYEGLTYGSDEWWDLTALLLERNIRPGASGFKEKTNFMSILGMAQQQGQKGKDAMPHGVAHLFYKDELGSQRTFNKENDLFFSKKEVKAIQTPGNYRDPTTGEVHNSYREFKAKKWADIVNYSEDIAIEAMKQWEAVNPKGNMDFTELVDYLNTLDNSGKLSRIKGKYQVPLIPNIIEEITEAQKELEHLDPVTDTYKAALVNRLLDMNLPQEFINSYVKKIAPGGGTVSLEKLPESIKKIKISNPRGRKKKYKK